MDFELFRMPLDELLYVNVKKGNFSVDTGCVAVFTALIIGNVICMCIVYISVITISSRILTLYTIAYILISIVIFFITFFQLNLISGIFVFLILICVIHLPILIFVCFPFG